MKVDVIIPIYRPDEKLIVLLEKLNSQSIKPNSIILMNTGKKYFDKFIERCNAACDGGSRFYERFPNVKVYHVKKSQFDHGGTRKLAVKYSRAAVFVMMTQDAIPVDDKLIEELIRGLSNEERGTVAVAYARQLADENCGVLETSSRLFNYPEESCTKAYEDILELGIKTFFCSDVCAAYRRDIFDRLGGFVDKTLFNEDMIYASEAIKSGYAIRYQAEAKVIHSHNYTNSQQFHRNFDLGVSQSQHPEVFAAVSSESEGKKLVAATTKRLLDEKQAMKLPHFYMQCVSKYAGYLLGKNYDKLPMGLVKKLTTNPGYFEDSDKTDI